MPDSGVVDSTGLVQHSGISSERINTHITKYCKRNNKKITPTLCSWHDFESSVSGSTKSVYWAAA